MITRRTFFSAAGVAAINSSSAAFAQPAARRIGFLSLGSAVENATRIDALRAGLRDSGYVEGRNLIVEYRWADGKAPRLPELAADLVKLDVEIIVTHGPPGIRAARQASSSIPIVIAAVGDVLAGGFVASLSRPGGNMTGMSFFSPQLAAKRLELLREALPRATQAGVLLNPDNPVNASAFEAVAATAKSLKLDVKPFYARSREDFDNAFLAMKAARLGTVTLIDDPMLNSHLAPLAELAAKHRMASLGGAEFPDAGGWLGYGASIPGLFRRSAYFVDRILKGAKPADLPIEQPTKFELNINQKIARELGLTVPSSLLLRADKVIE